MTLTAGMRLGPYELQSALGAGGMGEVYRARDTRLGREVAIKVLPPSFARDEDRLRRFEQEARTVAALNHPNILAVFDIGEHDGAPYIVCELLEGETLREKLQEGAFPQRRSVEYASQIAEGLAAAHDKGVVHRDLKPENVFVTRDGRVKILDFGLAKLARAGAAAAGEGATVTGPTHTTPGMVLGTAGYMSPEQVRGKDVDARTDIFALGAIVYEMVSGRRAFKGESSIETMNAILKEEPPELDNQALKVSPGLERIVRRCLEKEPARRFHSSRDVAFALEAISGSSAASELRRLPAERAGWIKPAAMIALAITAVAAAYLVGGKNGSSPGAVSYEQLTDDPGYTGPARFTRDGNMVVYSAAWNGGAKQLYTRRVNGAQATPLNIDGDVVGIADTGDMAVILNRRFLASWLQRGTLARLPLEGGAPRPILEDVYEADITRDGKNFAVVRSERGMQRLEFPIGKALYETAGWISDLRISPDGTQVAFIHHPAVPDDRGWVALVDSRSGGVRQLTPDYATGRSMCWAPDGKEIWYTASLQGEDTGLYAVNMSGKVRTVLRSPAELVVEDLSSSGKVLLESVKYQVEMGVKRSSDSHAGYSQTSVDLGAMSPDGQWVVFNRYEGDDYKSYVRKTTGTAAVKLGDGYGSGITPDGSMVAAALKVQPHKIYFYPTGAGEQKVFDLGEMTIAFGTYENDITFTRDGKLAVFAAIDSKNVIRDYLLNMHDGKVRPVTPPGTHRGKLSPDGSRIVTFDIAGQKNVMVDVASGKVSDVIGLEKQDEVLAWDADGRSLVLWDQQLPAHISLVDVSNGRRQMVQTVDPLAMLGSMYARLVTSTDGKTAAYRVRRGLYTIYIADGLK